MTMQEEDEILEDISPLWPKVKKIPVFKSCRKLGPYLLPKYWKKLQSTWNQDDKRFEFYMGQKFKDDPCDKVEYTSITGVNLTEALKTLFFKYSTPHDMDSDIEDNFWEEGE